MKNTGLVFSGKRYLTPVGTVAPPASLQDDSRYKNNGAFVSTPVWVQEPGGIWVLDFDGALDEVRVTDAPSLNSPTLSNRLGIEMWVKPMDYGAGQSTFLSKDYRQYEIYFDSGAPHWFKAYLGDGTNFDNYNSNSELFTGIYYLVQLSVDGSNIRLYVNGDLKNTQAQVRPLGTRVANLTFGCRSGSSLFFTGRQSLIRIYNYPPSSEMFAKHFESERRLFGV